MRVCAGLSKLMLKCSWWSCDCCFTEELGLWQLSLFLFQLQLSQTFVERSERLSRKSNYALRVRAQISRNVEQIVEDFAVLKTGRMPFRLVNTTPNSISRGGCQRFV